MESLMNFEYAFRYEVRADGPLEDTRGSPQGQKQYWRIFGGSLNGPRLRAQQRVDGSDWMLVSEDGYWRPDVRLPFLMTSVILAWLTVTGLSVAAWLMVRGMSRMIE